MTEADAVLAATTAIFAVVGVLFTLTTALRHNNAAGRAWSAAVVALLVACGVTLGSSTEPTGAPLSDTDFAGAVVVAALVVAAGLLWAGLRCFNDAAPRLPYPFGLAVACVVARALPWTVDRWVDAFALLVASAFLALGVREVRVGPMASNLNARLLTVTMVLFTAGGLWLALVVGIGEVPTRAALGFAAFMSVAVLQCLTALRVERHGAWWSGDSSGARPSLGVLDQERFETDARDRIERLGLVGGHAGLVVAAVDDLDAVNEALGRDVGDDTLVTLAAVIRSHVPPWAVVGHLGAGAFAVLVAVESAQRVQDVASSIETGLLDLRDGSAAAVRAPASFGTADTYSSPADLEQLLEVAQAARLATLEDAGA